MAIELRLKKEFSGIKPADHLSAIDIDGLALGVEYKAVFTRPRSSRQNSFYWVGLHEICRATGLKCGANGLHYALKQSCGLYEEHVNPLTGKVELRVSSTDFSSATQDEFNKFFEKARIALIERFGKGVLDVFGESNRKAA
jgi:hypothetical protein